MSTLSVPLTNTKYESLEVAAAKTDSAQDDSQATTEVVAPANLMAGYELKVNLNGKSATVVVVSLNYPTSWLAIGRQRIANILEARRRCCRGTNVQSCSDILGQRGK